MRLGHMPRSEEHTTPQLWIRGMGVQMANREKWREDVFASCLASADWASVKKFNGDFCAVFVREFAQRLRGWPQRLCFYRSRNSQL